MKKAVMEKWVAALRSGKYKQGKHRLKTKDGEYCCLGVLCDISGQGSFNEDNLYVVKGADPGYKVLPKPVMNLAGIRSTSGLVRTTSLFERTSLSKLNDDNKSFLEIADIIEKNYEDL